MKKVNRLRFVDARNSIGSKQQSFEPGSPDESLPAQNGGSRIQDLFPWEEEKKLLKALSRSSADGAFTEDEYVQFMSWATMVRKANNILILLMAGALKPVFKDKDIHFEPTSSSGEN
jgi:hypothetical protein